MQELEYIKSERLRLQEKYLKEARNIWLDFEGEEANEIEIQKMLIMHELSNDEQVSLMEFIHDLPYRVRRELGDATEIEDDIIPTIEGELAVFGRGSDVINEDYNVIID